MPTRRPRSRLGYALSSEEHTPVDLVRHAAMGEKHGFEFAYRARRIDARSPQTNGGNDGRDRAARG